MSDSGAQEGRALRSGRVIGSSSTTAPAAKRQRSSQHAQPAAAEKAERAVPPAAQGAAGAFIDGPAHTLIDPSLAALRQSMGLGNSIVSEVVTVASPLPEDSRAKPFAPNLLDLRISGVGATDADGGDSSGCAISRIELATVSGYYAGLATHRQPAACMRLPVGHAGVQLLVEAVYSKQVRLDATAAVDLLQAASYLQVECCLATASDFLMRHIFKKFPCGVLLVARSLGLEALEARIQDQLVANFFMYTGLQLARLLLGMEKAGVVSLLQRQDLCCPLECFLLEVLAHMAVEDSGLELRPLLACVRWGSMSAAELHAAVVYVQNQKRMPPQAAALLLGRLADACSGRLHWGHSVNSGLKRDAQRRSLQLAVAVGADRTLAKEAKSEATQMAGVGKVWLGAKLPRDSKPVRVVLFSQQSIAVGTTGWFLSFGKCGLRVNRTFPPEKECTSWYKPEFLPGALKKALRPGRNEEGLLLLLGCYLPEQG